MGASLGAPLGVSSGGTFRGPFKGRTLGVYKAISKGFKRIIHVGFVVMSAVVRHIIPPELPITINNPVKKPLCTVLPPLFICTPHNPPFNLH